MPTVLITGANRGIGLEFAKEYASSGYKVIAGVRNPATMPHVEGCVVVKIDSDSTTDAAEAVKELQKQGIKELDLVIANAAINVTPAKFVDVDIADIEASFKTNVVGPLVLFQATVPMIPKGGKFCFISSGAGTINKDPITAQGAYGQSKAALNFMMRKMHFEHPDILITAFSPGWLKTDMGYQGAKWGNRGEPTEDIKVTVPAMMKLLEEGDKKKLGGWMINWDGKQMDF